MCSICSTENLAVQIDNSDYNPIKLNTQQGSSLFSDSLHKSLHTKRNPDLTVDKNTKISKEKYRN